MLYKCVKSLTSGFHYLDLNFINKDFANVCSKGIQYFSFLKKIFLKIEKILTIFSILEKMF